MLLLLCPTFLFAQSQENALLLVYILALIFHSAKLLAIVSVVLLIIFRNKNSGVFGLVVGFILIVAGSWKLSRFILTESTMAIYVAYGCWLINISVILGWIYRKRSGGQNAVAASPDEDALPENNKVIRSLNVTFLTFILMGVYSAIIYFYDTPVMNTVYWAVNCLAPLVLLCLIAWFFIKKEKIGWIMGCGYLISNAIICVVNTFFYFYNMYRFNIQQKSLESPVASFIILTCWTILLLLSVSQSVRESFNVQKVHILKAVIMGVILSLCYLYAIPYLNTFYEQPDIWPRY